MASRLSRHLLSPSVPKPRHCILLLTRTKTSAGARHFGPPRPHEHSSPTDYLGSWTEPPTVADPREAWKRLQGLRRDYARQVSECRKQYMYEMQMQQAEKERKEEARREAARIAKEERKAAKKEADEARAARHRAFQEDLRQTLLKEKAEKLENWRAKEASREEKRIAKRDLLHKQSSTWIDESELEKKIRHAFTSFILCHLPTRVFLILLPS